MRARRTFLSLRFAAFPRCRLPRGFASAVRPLTKRMGATAAAPYGNAVFSVAFAAGNLTAIGRATPGGAVLASHSKTTAGLPVRGAIADTAKSPAHSPLV